MTDDTATTTIGKMDRFLFGFLFPMFAMVLGLLIIMSMPTNTGAAEFAALGILLGAVIISPLLLIVNTLLAMGPARTRAACFKRGMAAPALVMLGALLFQLGLWDAIF